MKPRADGSPDVSPKSGTLLEGCVGTESHTVLQESVYVILGHGRLQQLALLSTILSLILLLMHAFAYRLIGRPVDHWCQPPPDFRDLPVLQWKNVAIPVLADGSFSRCTVYDPPVPDDSQEERRVVPCDRWDYDTTDIGNSVVSMWNLVCEHSWLYYISSSVYMLGSLCLVPVAGIMADRVGRRPVILASAATMLLATMAAGSTQAFGVFLMARFLISATASATNVLNFIVLYELTGNEHRALYILLANSVGTTVTPALYAVLSLLHPSWRLSHALFVAASVIVLAWCYSLEESPVWQLATWRVRQAESTMLQAARTHGVDMAKARATIRALKRQLEKRETASGTGTGGSERMSLAATFRRRAMSIFLSWFAVIFAYYGSRTGRMSLENYWEVSAHGFKILILIAVYYSMKNRGQRVTLSAVLALLFVCSAFQTVSYEMKWGIAMPMSTLMVLCTTSAALCVNYGYTAEVFPTPIRSIGFCISYAIGRAGVLLVTLIEAFAGDKRIFAFNAVMTVLSLVSGVAVQWLPEVFSHRKKDTDPGTSDVQQRKEALKACLDPLQASPKAGKSNKPHRHRKSKRVPISGGASAAGSAATSGAASPASGGSPQLRTGSPPRKSRSPAKNNGPAISTLQVTASPSRYTGSPQ
ncbi:solute carrier family 22 member 6-like [Amblyomma americanum]